MSGLWIENLLPVLPESGIGRFCSHAVVQKGSSAGGSAVYWKTDWELSFTRKFIK